MKRSLIKTGIFCIAFFALCVSTITGQVKIGSAGTPNSNAVLELDGGTSKGLLLPKLTASEITALSTAPDGLIVYNKTDNFLYIRKSAAWQKINDATNGGGLSLPYNVSAASGGQLFTLTNTANGDAIWGKGTAGDGITGLSTSGNGGYFSSTSGNALVTNTGNVGIGTTTPSYLLDVNGRMRIRSNNDPFKSAGIFFDKIYTPGALSSFFGVVNDSTLGIYDITNNGWKFFFDHRNNTFGINTSDPKAPLSFSNANGNKLDIYYGSANSRYGIGLQPALMQLYSAGVTDDIAFGYGSSAAFTERMRIKGNGNVGIGSINPVSKLEVSATNTTQTGYFAQGGTGVALNAVSNGIALQATSFGTAPAIVANGSVKITDGTEGAGKVLTSDAAGKGSWVNTSYGNTERFQFNLSRSFLSQVFTFNTVYNLGTATGSYSNLVTGYTTIQIAITKSGLYHFDLNANQNVSGDYSPSSTINNKVKTIEFGLINSKMESYAPYFKNGSQSTYSFDKAFDIYISAPKTFYIGTFFDSGNFSFQLNITGHLIAE